MKKKKHLKLASCFLLYKEEYVGMLNNLSQRNTVNENRIPFH